MKATAGGVTVSDKGEKVNLTVNSGALSVTMDLIIDDASSILNGLEEAIKEAKTARFARRAKEQKSAEAEGGSST